MPNPQIIYLAGLPRAGTTLLCQLLNAHPQVEANGNPSPLCQTLIDLRHHLSENPNVINQISDDPHHLYQQLLNAIRGFINGWFADVASPWIVDRNVSWIQHLDLLNTLDPNFKVLVCIRELGQILGSIEYHHQQSLLLDFPDHLGDLSPRDRAGRLFAEEGLIGNSLHQIEAIQDYAPKLQEHLFYVVFEHLLTEPKTVIQDIFDWLELPSAVIDFQDLPMLPQTRKNLEGLKYPPNLLSCITSPQRYPIPPHFEVTLRENFTWFYETFYPGLL